MMLMVLMMMTILMMVLMCSKDDYDVYGLDDDDDSDDGDDVDCDYDSYETDDDDDYFYYMHVCLRAFIRPRAFIINSVATLIRPCVRKKPQPPHAVDWQQCYACMSTHIHHAIFTLDSPKSNCFDLCVRKHMWQAASKLTMI